MTRFDADRYGEEELAAEFEQLFPHGFAGPDVLNELAPAGWATSPLVAVCHPTVEQVYDEALRIHRNLGSLRRPDDARPLPPEPTLDEVARDYQERPVEPEREIRELVGQCLWDVFSDNHEVIAADGRRLDLGSFRASGGFLAEVLNRQIGAEPYGYLDFYMGTVWVAGRADLTPVYTMIFRRLRDRGLDWVYHFPRLCVVDMRPLLESLEPKARPEWEHYDPSEALAKAEEDHARDRQSSELRDSLDEAYREAVDAAQDQPPPATVRAYAAVYGHWPKGWPPVA